MHIWVFIAFSLLPRNFFIFKFCFIHLKNNSICHLCLYNSAISLSERLKSFVTSIKGLLPSRSTTTFFNGILAYLLILFPPGCLFVNTKICEDIPGVIDCIVVNSLILASFFNLVTKNAPAELISNHQL